MLLDWIRKLFHHSSGEKAVPAMEKPEDGRQESVPSGSMRTKPCLTCGKPVSFDPSWEHIPNYCSECKAKYRTEHNQRMIRRTCRGCGKTFAFPSTLKYYPNYCRECKARQKAHRKT